MGNHLFTYAVGDLNGDHALLTALLDRIHLHADGEAYKLVVLGNTIDAGTNPAAVLSALRAIELRAPDRIVTLRGWHEGLMARAGTPEGLAAWMQQGGAGTLRSFGVTRLADLPREVLDWVGRRPVEWRDELRRYVGDPEQALQATDNASSGLHLVHGASFIPGRGGQDKPREVVGITDIDTGAGLGGPLTAAIFTDLQAEPAGYFQALPSGLTRFLPPQQPNAAIREPRRALRIVNGEPETAAAWSLRQDAEIIAAQLANQKRARRRRIGMATAAGLVLLLGAGALLARPAASFVAGLLAPASRPAPATVAATAPAAPASSLEASPVALPTTAPPASPEPASPAPGSTAPGSNAAAADAPGEASAPAPAMAAGATPDTTRTHALPAEPVESPSVSGAAGELPASTASVGKAPALPVPPALAASPAAPPAGLQPAAPMEPASRETALGSPALPAAALTGEQDQPAAPITAPALPAAKPPPAKPAVAKPAAEKPAAPRPEAARPAAAPKPKAAAKPPAPRPLATAPRPGQTRPAAEPAVDGAGPIDLQALVQSPQVPAQAAPSPVRRAAPAKPPRAARAPKPPSDIETQSIGGGLD